ncbi:hypothetical protein Cgig2_014743 [Carnegiea gigantea]|uniref:Uncharacterized protein n=1 Tax=Carnegiea gigantea TaxID=171969 RepID=A0A9Q1L1K9_9CARY|nr:hypothetical protein Cgig2_014743 [Carnegiea gigantea]
MGWLSPILKIFSLIFGLVGFGVGISIGLIVGYYLFIYVKTSDVKDPDVRPLAEQDSDKLQHMLAEIPLWVKTPDYDRIDWLNQFIGLMWPYLDKAICKTAKNIAMPIIAEQIPNYRIDSVEFERLTLGSLPPTFQGMKVYVTDEKELIMEPSLKWAGNPDITVAVRAFGLKATAQVVDLQVFACPRITLKPLVPSFPCFCKIILSLMEKPHVDFGLKVFGADLMSIPILYRFVQELIKDQVANMYLWPRTLEVPILDPTKYGQFSYCELLFTYSRTISTIQMNPLSSIVYVTQICRALRRPVGILHVKVLRAMNLRKLDFLGASDPYVKLKLTEDKVPAKQTKVKFKNLNPEWNEEFKLTVRDLETQALIIRVYDWEKVGKHDKMGMNSVPLKDLMPHEPKEVALDLLKSMDPDDQNDKSRGQIVVTLTYKAFTEEELGRDFEKNETMPYAPEGTPAGGGVLVVKVHEAQALEGKRHTNPSVKVTFRGDEKKTKKIKKNRDPRWDEEFQFIVEEPPVNDKLHVEVFSSSKRMGIYHKESLGYINIMLSDVVNNKRINQKYNLIDSKNGRIQVELQWRTPPPKS